MNIKVKSSALKKAIKEMSYLYKYSEQYRAFNMTIHGSSLYISANTGLRYETDLRLAEPATEDYDVNLLYQDISELLGERGDVTLDMTPVSCTVLTGVFEVTFTESNDSVTPLRRPRAEYTEEISDHFADICKTLTNTLTFRKAYKLTPLLTFNGSKSCVKFPTVWIETDGGYLHKTITMETAEVIQNFHPTEFVENEDTVVFYNDTATLIVPASAPESNTFDQLVRGMNLMCELDVTNIVSAMRKITRILGNGQVNLFFSPKGLRMQIMRAGIHSMLTFGEMTQINLSVQLPLEFVFAVFSLLGSTVKIFYGGGKLCLQNFDTRILMSVNS